MTASRPARRVDPTWARYKAAYRAGSAAYRARRFAEAERYFRQALALRKSANNQANLASSILQQGRLREAEQLFLTALRYQSGHANSLHGLSYLHNERGRQAQAARRYSEALTHYRRSVKIKPTQAARKNAASLQRWLIEQRMRFGRLTREDIYWQRSVARARLARARALLATVNGNPRKVELGAWHKGQRLTRGERRLPGLAGSWSTADGPALGREIGRASSEGASRFRKLCRHFGSIVSEDLRKAAADQVDAALSKASIRLRVGAIYKFRKELKSYVDPALAYLFDPEAGALTLLPSILAYGPRTKQEQAFAARPDSLERAMARKLGGVRGTAD